MKATIGTFVIMLGVAVSSAFGADLLETGGTMTTNNLAVSIFARPFAKDVIDDGSFQFHQIRHLSDGIYGNSNSWISGSANSYAAIGFHGIAVITNVAWGRGEYQDRYDGTYTLQYTTVAYPDTGTPDVAWTTIFSTNYTASVPDATPWLRHRWGFAPVQATGIRLVCSVDGTCVDELEVYGTKVSGWLELVGSGGSMTNMGKVNYATNVGATAFAQYEYTTYTIAKLNNGLYGTDQAWFPNVKNSYCGIDLGGSYRIDRVAWGRDNTGYDDNRWEGLFTVQYTTVPNPGTNTPDSAWSAIFAVNYASGSGLNVPDADQQYRHVYKFPTVEATGVRLVITTAPGPGYPMVDELEVYADPPPKGTVIIIR